MEKKIKTVGFKEIHAYANPDGTFNVCIKTDCECVTKDKHMEWHNRTTGQMDIPRAYININAVSDKTLSVIVS